MLEEGQSPISARLAEELAVTPPAVIMPRKAVPEQAMTENAIVEKAMASHSWS